MWTLYPDVEFSRRKRLHHILDEHDVPQWSGAQLAAALRFLAENGQNEFRIEGALAEEHWLVQIHRD